MFENGGGGDRSGSQGSPSQSTLVRACGNKTTKARRTGRSINTAENTLGRRHLYVAQAYCSIWEAPVLFASCPSILRGSLVSLLATISSLSFVNSLQLTRGGVGLGLAYGAAGDKRDSFSWHAEY